MKNVTHTHLLAAALGLLLISFGACRTRAQQADSGLLLAIVGVHEAGFHSTADHRAIAAITIRQARIRHMDLDTWIVTRFTRALRPSEERNDRLYLPNLRRGEERPEGWREHKEHWSEYAPFWARALETVDDVIQRGGRGECLATIWGSPDYDREEIDEKLRNGWEIVDCGPTRNVFLRRVR